MVQGVYSTFHILIFQVLKIVIHKTEGGFSGSPSERVTEADPEPASVCAKRSWGIPHVSDLATRFSCCVYFPLVHTHTHTHTCFHFHLLIVIHLLLCSHTQTHSSSTHTLPPTCSLAVTPPELRDSCNFRSAGTSASPCGCCWTPSSFSQIPFVEST